MELVLKSLSVGGSLLELFVLNFCDCNNECLMQIKRRNEIFLVVFILKPRRD